MSGRFRSVVASYVRGHDRVWDVARMRGGPAPASEPHVEWGGTPARPRFGVGVARTLDFGRGPAMGTASGPPQGTKTDD